MKIDLVYKNRLYMYDEDQKFPVFCYGTSWLFISTVQKSTNPWLPQNISGPSKDANLLPKWKEQNLSGPLKL